MFLLALIIVAPYGQGSTCTIDAPCTLQSVMAANSVTAGETVYLLPGTYKGDFWSLVSGTQAQPITFRSVPGTRVVIDGSLRIDGADTTWRGIEIMYTGWTSRTLAVAGSHPPGLAQTGLFIFGARTRIEQCSVHDTSEGIGFWSTALDGVIDGCLISNNGWTGPDRTHGHAIYAQNASGTKTIKNTIILPQYDIGLHIYGSAAASLIGFDVISNTIVNSPSLIGGGSPTGRVTVRNNVVWGNTFDLGYWGVENNQDATVIGNVFAATLMASGWQSLTITDNRFERMSDQFRVHYPPAHARYQIDQNAYACSYALCPALFTLYTTGNQRSFAAWQTETPYDTSSTIAYSTPGQDRVIVGADQVTILNYTNAPTVSIDLAPLNLTPGASYKLVNAQNVAETQLFVAGALVSVPMAGWTVATPYAASAPLTTWDSRFSVFMVTP